MSSPAITHLFASPFGTVRVEADDVALRTLTLADEEHDRTSAPPTPLIAQLMAELDEYFAGKRRTFGLPLAPRGTEFQKAVWTFLQTIPYGETRSYGEVARALGREGASRAVGAANGQNPLWIVIPCHRVIGSSGSLTGYAGGIERKRGLLTLEARGAGGHANGAKRRAAGVVQPADECRSLSPRGPQSSIFCPVTAAPSTLAI